MSGSARPQGQVTRGTTAPNRLRRFDRWICYRAGPLLRRSADPLVVDLGFGGSPVTTLELADRVIGCTGRPVEVVGVEIDPVRVAAAEEFARPGVGFRRGGFEIPLAAGRRADVIRAANVLRQYEETEVGAAWQTMVMRLSDHGLLVEGTCDELGRIGSWVTIPVPPAGVPPLPDSLTLSVDLARLERPSQVAERLPKSLIHHNVPGQPVFDLLSALDEGWQRSGALRVFGARQRWLGTVEHLIGQGWPILHSPTRWRLGELSVPWQCVAPAG